jgi:thiol-disulfide isomerase/thioredoxin
MTRRLFRLTTAAAALLLFGWGAAAAQDPPAPGDGLAQMTLTSPAEPGQRDDLGLTGEAPFDLSEIRAELLLIEVFSMYCPYCQAEAPEVNRLYERVREMPGLGERLRMIGIGAGNSAFEVEVFRKKYDVPFPLFPDPDFTIHKKLGEVGTPFFILARKQDQGGGWKVLHTRAGSLNGSERYLEEILALPGVKEDGT